MEKTQWEAMTSKQRVEKLQNDIDSMQGEFSSFMVLLNGLTKNNPTTDAEDYDVAPYHLDHLPSIVSSHPMTKINLFYYDFSCFYF